MNSPVSVGGVGGLQGSYDGVVVGENVSSVNVRSWICVICEWTLLSGGINCPVDNRGAGSMFQSIGEASLTCITLRLDQTATAMMARPKTAWTMVVVLRSRGISCKIAQMANLESKRPSWTK